MKVKQSVSQKMTQSLKLRPKMIQSLEMLTLPLMELELYVKQEIQTNPVLELKEEREDEEEKNENQNETETEETTEEETKESETDEELEKTLEEVKQLSETLDYWYEEYIGNEKRATPAEKADAEKYVKSIENYKEKIYMQIDLNPELNENEKEFAYDMIESMDSYGFLPSDYDIYQEAKEFDLNSEDAEKVHKVVMKMEPKGLTARNLEECLIAQLDENSHEYDYVKILIEKHFEDLIHKRYKKIASSIGVTEDLVKRWKDIISKLDPKPGLRIQNSEKNYIEPEIILKKIDGKYEIILNDFNFPKIRISRYYTKVLQQVKKRKGYTKEDLKFVRDKLNSAKFLVKSIYLRNKTLKDVVREIINYQYDFFYKDKKVLKPMGYAIIANKLGVNESTISRVVRSKYIDTPFGIISLKEFFTSRAGKDDDYNDISRQNVENIIKNLIDSEDKSNPLSDKDITDILKEKGMNVSRRVVAKYRKALGYLNSHLRKE
jgi:RNA polymerase sigma-54 factor